MASGDDGSIKDELFRALYDSFIADGFPPQEAGSLAATFAEKSSLNSAAVDNYLRQAWAMVPSNLPLRERALFAWAILTAMRGNLDPWNSLEAYNKDFQKLKLKPPPPDKNPENIYLAYAQHYALARFITATTGDVQGTQQAVGSYDRLKELAFEAHLEGLLKTDPKHNPSKPSQESELYGNAGALRGMKDYQETYPGSKAQPGGALRLLIPSLIPLILKKLNLVFNSQPVTSVSAVCLGPSAPGADLSVTGTLLSSPPADAGTPA